MTTCVYRFEIPDPARPISAASDLAIGPSGELAPFEPPPLLAAQIVGRRIEDVNPTAGAYGMGGPGFFALRLGGDWLVVAVWGAGSWMSLKGRPLEDWRSSRANWTQPWLDETDGCGALCAELVGESILAFDVEKHALRIGISGGCDLTIERDPAARPAFAGDGRPRAFKPDDDLRRAVFLAPTPELWI
jgi:hypothetical protein